MPTPHMQAFADRATVFRKAHCAAPTCSPSRAALLTGQTAHQAGMLGLQHRGFDMKDYSQHLGSFLTSKGYDTVYSGVQHEFHPDSEQELPYRRQLKPSVEEGTRDQMATRAASEYLDEVGETPFYLWTGMFYPHREFLPSDPSKRNPDHIQPPVPVLDTPETRQDMADYMESVEHADACFGEIMAALDRNGLREKTIVILTTDHGIAFPEMKCNLTQHGTGVTLIMDYPGNPAQGQSRDALVSHMDVFPTLCELLELEKPDHLIGNSMKPVFNNPSEEIREEAFAEVTFHAGREFMRSVRTSRYNYVRILDRRATTALVNIDPGYSKSELMSYGLDNDSPRDRVQLYDLVFDPQERRNLASHPEYREVRLDMEKRLQRWMVVTDDPLMQSSFETPESAILDGRDEIDPGGMKPVTK